MACCWYNTHTFRVNVRSCFVPAAAAVTCIESGGAALSLLPSLQSSLLADFWLIVPKCTTTNARGSNVAIGIALPYLRDIYKTFCKLAFTSTRKWMRKYFIISNSKAILIFLCWYIFTVHVCNTYTEY